MKACTIGLPVIVIGVAALLSAGCDSKGEVAQAATNAAVVQAATNAAVVQPATSAAVTPVGPPSQGVASETTASRATTPPVPAPEGGGPGTAAPDASNAAAAPPAAAAPQAPVAPQNAGAALQAARDQKKYLFVAFYRPDDAKNEELMRTFGEAEKSLGERALFYAANIQEEKERPMVQEYQVTRAPLPLTLVFASNGAFVNAFRGKSATKSELEASFLSPKFTEVVKPLQDRKIVLCCVQGKSTQHNAESLAAARATSEAKESNGMITVVEVAPEDEASKDLLAQLKVTPTMKEAAVFVLVPPANLAGKVEGATTKEAVWQTVLRGVSSCGAGGCGPGGCGPSAGTAKK